jgi:hypothetical protein
MLLQASELVLCFQYIRVAQESDIPFSTKKFQPVSTAFNYRYSIHALTTHAHLVVMQPFTQIRAGSLAQVEERAFDFGTWAKGEGPTSSDRGTKHTGTESQCGGLMVFTRGWVA